MSIGIRFSFHGIAKCIILAYILVDCFMKLLRIYGFFPPTLMQIVCVWSSVTTDGET
jgi:hypothetical protein